MKRRTLLNTAIAAGTASVLVSEGSCADAAGARVKFTDTNVNLFRWPFRRLPLDETAALLEKMRELGIDRAWAGSFEGILHRDVAGVNRRLAEVCEKHPQLVPIGSVNLKLPDWEHDLAECAGTHRMPGIRVHPNYHGYALDDPRFMKLLRLATEKGLFVQIAALLEDIRTQPEKVQVADVDLSPLPEIVKQLPGARVQILNWRPRGAVLEKLADTPGVFFDTARIDATDGVAKLLEAVPADRVLFGTHAPFLIPEAALIRVHESDLPDATVEVVMHSNAEAFLK